MKKYKPLLVVFLMLGFNQLFAQTDNIHLSFKRNDGTGKNKSMAITWTSSIPCNGTLRYGTDSLKLNTVVKVEYKAASNQEKLFYYKVVLENLMPTTTYYYQCSANADRCNEKMDERWSTLYTFTTAPVKGTDDKFTVGVWGDTQNNEGNKNFEQTSKIVGQLIKYPLNFTVHMGDIVENGSVVPSWNAFFHTTQPLNANVPFMPVTGNHDVVNDQDHSDFQKPFPIFYEMFNLPENNLNYSYDYGNTHFIAISSGYCQGAVKVDKVLFQKDSPEYKWLENDLKQARGDKKIKWIIMYDHYPMYSFGVSLVPQWQNQLTPIIDKYKIDLVLSGHRHVYERHAAIRGTKIQQPENSNLYHKPEGTVYITNGSAGGSLQGIGGKDLPSMLYTSPKKMYTYAIMTIVGKQLSYDVYNDNGERIDYFKIIK